MKRARQATLDAQADNYFGEFHIFLALRNENRRMK